MDEEHDPLWWIVPKIEETEEECEARLRRISEDLKEHYRAKKYGSKSSVVQPKLAGKSVYLEMFEAAYWERSILDSIARSLEPSSKKVKMIPDHPVLDYEYYPMKKTMIIMDDSLNMDPSDDNPQIKKTRGFSHHLQHPKSYKR